MKFKLLAFGISCFIGTYGLTQEQEKVIIKVEYEFTHIIDTTQRDNPIKQNYILYVGKGLSKYSDMFNAMAEEGKPVSHASVDASGNPERTIRMGFDRPLYKRTDINKFYMETPQPQKVFEVEDTLPKFNWNMTKDVRTIKGYMCQKAIVSWKGRDYNVWFCSKLPYNNGPWKFSGLPGLILEIEDKKKEVLWNALKVEEVSYRNIFISMRKGATIVTQAEYRKLEMAIRADAMAMKGAALASNPNVIVTSKPMPSAVMTSGGQTKTRGYNNPIELIR